MNERDEDTLHFWNIFASLLCVRLQNWFHFEFMLAKEVDFLILSLHLLLKKFIHSPLIIVVCRCRWITVDDDVLALRTFRKRLVNGFVENGKYCVYVMLIVQCCIFHFQIIFHFLLCTKNGNGWLLEWTVNNVRKLNFGCCGNRTSSSELCHVANESENVWIFKCNQNHKSNNSEETTENCSLINKKALKPIFVGLP
jgi:hypothetical protein